MLQTIGPVSIGWGASSEETSQTHQSPGWWVSLLDPSEASRRLGSPGVPWFNHADWSGIETADWVAWISNRSKAARVSRESPGGALGEPLSVVIPAILRREGLVDGHGAIVAPDPRRPDDGIFITGLSGSGKSTLTVSAALGGARLVSDDSVAIGHHAGA